MIRLALVVALLLPAAPALAQTAPKADTIDAVTFLAANRAKKGVVETASGLHYQVLYAGEPGARPTDSDVALVIYEGKFADGTAFDASPWAVPMPVSAVVPGFAEALKLMPNGARYRFWIKPELGYGVEDKKDESGKVVIPGGAVLMFDVRMLDFISGARYQALMTGAPSGN